MIQQIGQDPTDERQLIETKDFITKAPAEVERLTEVLKSVNKHYELLEEFSYMYNDKDIEQFWYMKIYPLRIAASLTDGKNMITEKNELFSANLEKEKEKFQKDIALY